MDIFNDIRAGIKGILKGESIFEYERSNPSHGAPSGAPQFGGGPQFGSAYGDPSFGAQFGSPYGVPQPQYGGGAHVPQPYGGSPFGAPMPEYGHGHGSYGAPPFGTPAHGVPQMPFGAGGPAPPFGGIADHGGSYMGQHQFGSMQPEFGNAPFGAPPSDPSMRHQYKIRVPKQQYAGGYGGPSQQVVSSLFLMIDYFQPRHERQQQISGGHKQNAPRPSANPGRYSGVPVAKKNAAPVPIMKQDMRQTPPPPAAVTRYFFLGGKGGGGRDKLSSIFFSKILRSL